MGCRSSRYVAALKNTIKPLWRYLRSKLGQDVYFPVQTHITRLRYGSDYGGYDVCPDELTSESIVYSFGVGDDISFDLALIERHGCRVLAYDPSPESKLWLSTQRITENFLFHDVGLWTEDSTMPFYPSPNKRINYGLIPKRDMPGPPVDFRVRRLKSIMEENGHDRIDLLKLDIEGAEFDVIDDILHCDVRIHQLVVEFHYKHKEFEGRGVELLSRTISLLNDKGYRIFSVSPGGIEYSFMKK